MKTPNDATIAQIKAARPDRSTWLSANAGSGKTRVLTDRVARLLLENVQPQHILCLTYTKAAASEMQNRLFKRLGEWAMQPDGLLREQLSELGLQGYIQGETLANARRLFARAIEAPGGLKIQTIHSFCSSLLRRFPLEARVAPQFTEMDDRAAALLREDISNIMSDGPDRGLVASVAQHFTGEDFGSLTAEIARNKSAFKSALSFSDTLSLFNLPENFTKETLLSQVFLGSEISLFEKLLTTLRAGSPTDQKAAVKLSAISIPSLASLPILEAVFLTGKGAKSPFSAKIDSFPTKASQENLGDHQANLNALMARIETAREARLSLAAVHKTFAIQGFARAFITHYEASKQARGWLDFDDLILKARDLLTDPNVAAWVLYRLDGGIDHILVDEAQDTSPVQWNVIERLAQEFTSGEGARADVLRTIFVVGDKKQSIYSFQGADPAEFDRMQADFANRLIETDSPLQSLELEYSFRSSHAILHLVDQTFANKTEAGFSPTQTHHAFNSALPGRVDLWPIVETAKKPDEGEWYTPVNLRSENHHTAILAKRIAQEIRQLIDEKVQIPLKQTQNSICTGRAVHAGDFLILVQRRSPLFHEIIRECKAHNLPIAGADRLKVGAELAVRDLAALLGFLATPEDDLALASALKSPLFGWSEQDLFSLAHDRKGYLWEALRKQTDAHPSTLEILNDLRQNVDFLRPYDLIERILTRHDGRRNLLSRLGVEAEDGIDALLSQALAYERISIPSLTGFLVWMETDTLEIKRQMDSAGDRIRVMTVHGAKGLEAPIVILPDTGQRRNEVKNELLRSGDHVIWKTRSDDTPAQIQTLIDAQLAKQEAERERLLYVAMTRAEKWLIVVAAGELGKDGQSWYDKVRTGMIACSAAPHAFSFGGGLRIEHGDWAGLETVYIETTEEITTDLPAYFTSPAPIPEASIRTLAPSDLGGAKALPGETGLDEDSALRRGRQIHTLLEFLPNQPKDNWENTAKHLLAHGDDAAQGQELDLLLAEVNNVLTRPGLQPLFLPDALAEVPITANIPGLSNRRIHGILDRLIIKDDHILAVDFKTNASVPNTPDECPDGLLRQMGAYSQALALVFPGHKIETALLWTRNATLMRLPHELVIGALCDTQIP